MEKKRRILYIVLGCIIFLIVGIIIFLVFKLNKTNSNNQEKIVKNPIATIDVVNYGEIKIELYPNEASNTVKNFIALANNKYYGGLKFFRVVKDFCIQAGDNNSNRTGTPFLSDLYDDINEKDDKQYAIKGEFLENGIDNNLKLEEGTVIMARCDYNSFSESVSLEEQSYNSAGAQFCILTKDAPELEGIYAPFGKVIEGMDIVHKIENVKLTDEEDSEEPEQDIVIYNITVDTFGEKFEEPETLDVFDYENYIASILEFENQEDSKTNEWKKERKTVQDNLYKKRNSDNYANHIDNSTTNNSNGSKKYIHSAQQGCILINPSTTSESVHYKYKCEYCGAVSSLEYSCYPLSYGGTYKGNYNCKSCKKNNTAIITTIEN